VPDSNSPEEMARRVFLKARGAWPDPEEFEREPSPPAMVTTDTRPRMSALEESADAVTPKVIEGAKEGAAGVLRTIATPFNAARDLAGKAGEAVQEAIPAGKQYFPHLPELAQTGVDAATIYATGATGGLGRKAAQVLDPLGSSLTAGSQAGAALHGGPIGQLAEGGAQLANELRFAPKLSRYDSATKGLKLDDKLSLVQSAANTSVDTALERSMSLQRTFTPEEAHYLRRYLVAKDEAARLKSGVSSVEGGRDIATVEAEIQNASAMLDPAKLQQAENDFRRWSDESYDRLTAAGHSVGKREDYVPHLIREYMGEQEAGRTIGASSGVVQPRVGQAKQATGSEKAIERDPYRAMAMADYVSRRAEEYGTFFKEITQQHGQNAAVRAGTAKVDDIAFVAYDRAGKPVVLDKPETNKLLARLRANPGQGAGGFTVNGRTYNALPRDLAEGLVEAGGRFELGGLGKIAATGASASRNVNLLLNPAFHAFQWPADIATGLFNVKVRDWPRFFGEFAQNVGRLSSEYASVGVKGTRSPLIEGLRKKGILTEIPETLFDYSDPQHIITGRGAPVALKPGGAGLKDYFMRGVDKAEGAIKSAGNVRETAIKKTLTDIFQSYGAEPERAAFWANRVTGKYIKSSPAGKLAGTTVNFLKWATEQLLRLTVDFATDPATGKYSVQGFTSGPWPKIAAYAVFQQYLNTRNPEVAKQAANLPSHARAGIVAGKRPDGDYDVYVPDTLAKLAFSAFDTIMEAKQYGARAAGKSTLQSLLGRTNPVLRTPIEYLTGKKLGSDQPINPLADRGIPTDKQVAINQKQGGLPVTPETQYLVEGVGGAIPRLFRQLQSKDTSRGDTVLSRLAGVPRYAVGPKDKVAEEAAKYTDVIFQRYIDAKRDGNAEEAKASRAWLRQHGMTAEEIRLSERKGKRMGREYVEKSAEDRRDKKRRDLRPYEP
jgi:hypothetical protein